MPAASRHEDGRCCWWIRRSKWLRIAHLFQRLRGVLKAHEGLTAVARTPDLKKQDSSGRGIVDAAINDPVNAQGPSDRHNIAVVPHNDE